MSAAKIYNAVMISLAIIWGLIFFVFYPHSERIRDSYSKESFYGVVKEKYIDYDDHTSRKFKDVHNNIYYLPVAQRSILFDSIMIGDSIVKRKGELTGYVYRNDSLVLEIDYSTSIPK